MSRAPGAMFRAARGGVSSWAANSRRQALPVACAAQRLALLSRARAAGTAAVGGLDSDLAAVHKNPIVEQLWTERATLSKCSNPLGRPAELLTKTPSCSRVEVEYNFADNRRLADQYASPWGTMRFGKLVEDLDALAGNVAFKHADDDDPDTRLPLLVTASVDRIRLEPGMTLPLDKNYKLSGRVIWVGRSSMLIRMELSAASAKTGAWVPHLRADFTFVARDAVSGGAVAINKLAVESEEERRLFQEVEDKQLARKRARQAGAASEDSAGSEATRELLARELLQQGRLLEDMPGLAAGDAVLHRQTKHFNTFMCYPQQRNTAGRVFGGYLMRQAYELAFSTAYKFAGAHPRFVEIGEVVFLRHVDIGDLVNMAGSVILTYTKVRPQLHVEVVAYVLNPEEKHTHVTNTFSFTFELRPEAGKAVPSVKRVFPSTLECARRVVEVMEKAQGL